MDRFKRIQDVITPSVKASGVQSLTGTSGFGPNQNDKNNINAKKKIQSFIKNTTPIYL